MALRLDEELFVTSDHLDPTEVVAYVDRVTTPAARARIETHLSVCAECREEVSDAARIIGKIAHRRVSRRGAIVSAAGIAAALLVFLLPRPQPRPSVEQHRGAERPSSSQPAAIAPIGAVDSVGLFVWSPEPGASRYEVSVFDSAGTVLWSAHTIDTVLPGPGQISFRPQVAYYWKVEAQIEVGRSVSSTLAQFSVAPRNRR